MRILYFYLMAPGSERIGAVAPLHAAYWRDLQLPEYLGGPFADRSGGLITFASDSIEQALALTEADPFAREGLLERSWTSEWLIE